MALNSLEMRRMIMGEDNKFIESLLGRATLIVLFTAVFSVVLALLFLINRDFSPVLLKYTFVTAIGLIAGFMSRRLLRGRHPITRLLVAIFAIAISFGVLNVLTQGFIGLNLLRAYQNPFAGDVAVQVAVSALAAWTALSAWAGTHREVLVEPRWTPEPEPIVAQPARRATRPVRSGARAGDALLTSISRAWDRGLKSTRAFLAPAASPSTRTRRKTKKTKTRGRGIFSGRTIRRKQKPIALTSQEAHVCPYCLEPVRQRDPRGVKICKVCKTWHHGDCWAVTGVCQVPHQYAN
jgi:ribosomal protein L37AE/L43A